MNQYNKTGSVRICARPGCAHVTMLRPYCVNTLIHPNNHSKQQPLLLGVYGVHAHKIINHFMQNNGPGIFQHDNAMSHKMSK